MKLLLTLLPVLGVLALIIRGIIKDLNTYSEPCEFPKYNKHDESYRPAIKTFSVREYANPRLLDRTLKVKQDADTK